MEESDEDDEVADEMDEALSVSRPMTNSSSKSTLVGVNHSPGRIHHMRSLSTNNWKTMTLNRISSVQ